MRKSLFAIVVYGAVAWSSVAWAIVGTGVTVSNNQSETASATIKVEQLDKSGKKIAKKTTRIHLSKDRPSGHRTVTIDEKKTSTISVVVIFQRDGKTVEETHSVPVADFINHEFNLGHGLTLQNTSGGVRSTRTAGGRPSTSAVPYAPMAPFPTGFYVVGIIGGANNCTDQAFLQIISLGGADAFDPNQRSTCGGSSFLYGGAVGGNFDTPFISPFFNTPIQAGAEVSILGASGGSSTFQGTPTTLLGPAPGTDTFTTKDNYFIVVNGTLTVPITPTLSIFGKAGYGWANKTVTYNCFGFCDLAGTQQFSQSKTITLGGPAVGGGLNWSIVYDEVHKRYFILQFDYEHIFLNQETVQFGDPATVFNSSRVGQDVNLFTARVVFPLSGPESYPGAAVLSDARLKRDVVLLGHLDNGLGLYRYRYKWSDQRYVGVMAQEVALIRPDAVVHGVDEYLRVNYARLGLHLQTWEEWAAR